MNLCMAMIMMNDCMYVCACNCVMHPAELLLFPSATYPQSNAIMTPKGQTLLRFVLFILHPTPSSYVSLCLSGCLSVCACMYLSLSLSFYAHPICCLIVLVLLSVSLALSVCPISSSAFAH